jgi:ligand-binding sensor domain-containing protein
MGTRVAVLLLCLGVFLAYPQASSAQWVQTSGPEGCHVTALAAGGGNLYSVVEGHGIFLSTDNGAKWVAVSAGWPPNQEVTCIKASGGKLFVGTDRGFAFFSTDRGASWQQIRIGFQNKDYWREVKCFALIGADLIIGTKCGLYVCPDHTSAAEAVPLKLPEWGSVDSLAVMGPDLYVGGFKGAVFLVRKNGQAWTVSKLPFPKFNWPACFEVSGSDLFAGSEDGVFISSDRGSSWKNIVLPLSTDPCVTSLVMSGRSLMAVFTYLAGSPGPAGVRISRDSGQAWATVRLGLNKTIVNCLAVTGRDLFAGTSNGIYLSSDSGTTWKRTSSGLPVASRVEYLAAIGPNIFAGASHGDYHSGWGSLHMSPDKGGTWKAVGSDLPAHSAAPCLVAIGPNLFAGLRVRGFDEKGKGVYLSPDNGETWITVSSGLPPAAAVGHLAVIGQTAFASTHAGIYMSSNNGASWEACSEGLPAGPSSHLISCLVAAGLELFLGLYDYGGTGASWPALPAAVSLSAGVQNLFAGVPPPGGRLYILAKDSTRWKDTRIRFSVGIRCFAKIGSKLFVGNNNGLYLCENYSGSQKPSKVEGSIDFPASCLAEFGTSLVLGNSMGVYVVKSDGGNWRFIDTGMPGKISVLSLAMTETDLFAGTEERGVWRLPLAELKKFRP